MCHTDSRWHYKNVKEESQLERHFVLNVEQTHIHLIKVLFNVVHVQTTQIAMKIL